MTRGRIPFRVALGLTPDDLPDGAYFAMAHEIAGLEYGEGFGELTAEYERHKRRPIKCAMCRKRFVNTDAFKQHNAMKHGGTGREEEK